MRAKTPAEGARLAARLSSNTRNKGISFALHLFPLGLMTRRCGNENLPQDYYDRARSIDAGWRGVGFDPRFRMGALGLRLGSPS